MKVSLLSDKNILCKKYKAKYGYEMHYSPRLDLTIVYIHADHNFFPVFKAPRIG